MALLFVIAGTRETCSYEHEGCHMSSCDMLYDQVLLLLHSDTEYVWRK